MNQRACCKGCQKCILRAVEGYKAGSGQNVMGHGGCRVAKGLCSQSACSNACKSRSSTAWTARLTQSQKLKPKQPGTAEQLAAHDLKSCCRLACPASSTVPLMRVEFTMAYRPARRETHGGNMCSTSGRLQVVGSKGPYSCGAQLRLPLAVAIMEPMHAQQDETLGL
jgi:hypothetical protein